MTMSEPTMTYRDRAAIEAYRNCRVDGKLAHEAWEAALRAYGDSSVAVRERLNRIITPQDDHQGWA